MVEQDVYKRQMLHDYVGGGMLRLGKDSISINKPLIKMCIRDRFLQY